MSGATFAVFTRVLRVPATHSSCTSRWVIRHAIGSRMIRYRVTLVVRIVGYLTRMRCWVVHVVGWSTDHMWITRVVIMGSSIMSVRNVISTVHNRIWVRTVSLVMMLSVRTWVVHLG